MVPKNFAGTQFILNTVTYLTNYIKKSLRPSTDGTNWNVGALKTRGVAKINSPTP